ncbi:MAG TPA: hypothetical protein PKW33_17480 [Anaerolineaceae bacterium]|nr:hypothetical protein [Anaerolineaceae bacterium]HPN53393.1 hypothetical protein [Anaerolineaceae bacterium]
MNNPSLSFLLRVVVKAALLFAALNLIFAVLQPMPALGSLSAYNALFPGRERLPFGERPDKAYNFSLYSLEAMFASHRAAAVPAGDEFRVMVVGDSSVWGTLLTPEQTLSGQLNALGLKTSSGQTVRFYNFGYPTISITKDLLVLDWIRRYDPDMVIWMTTLEGMPRSKQLTSPILQNNAAAVRRLIDAYQIDLDKNDPAFATPGFWDQTIVGQRRALADLFRLQVYGVLWAATGVDQYYPEKYEAYAVDLEADPLFQKLSGPHLKREDLSLDVLRAGMASQGGIPVLLVNEPMALSTGKNSDIRYNFFYPRWAYDDYRVIMQEEASLNQWHYLDLWDAIDAKEFTNSAIHLTPAGSAELARLMAPAVQQRLP